MAISVPTSGSMAALAAWKRKTAKVKTIRERLRSRLAIEAGATAERSLALNDAAVGQHRVDLAFANLLERKQGR